MKRTITMAICLMIFQASHINANVETHTTNGDSLTSKSKNELIDKVKTSKKDTEVLTRIPNGKLDLSVNQSREVLNIELTGLANKNLEWIIHKAKGEVVSRIITAANIDKILIDSLSAGNYILMIKDKSGRVLHQAFTKIK